ncbi:MAG: CehA/McbA family metallohydrolase [Anaerolineaceae bacterium]
MEELITNLHVHSVYSDGSATHRQIALEAIKSDIDVLITTDHNVRVYGLDGYFENGQKKVLLLTGEEVHDQGKIPQKNHMLVLGASKELATFAKSPQNLIDQTKKSGGYTFLAHPFESDLPQVGEDNISWEDWSIRNYSGIELWNGFSELKTVSNNWIQLLFYVLFPQFISLGPLKETLNFWDSNLMEGNRIFAVGGSDAHALNYQIGFIKKTVFRYQYHFRSVNTHILLPSQLSGDLSSDRNLIFQSLGKGHSFIANDWYIPSRGFKFTAQGEGITANLGETIPFRSSVTLQVKTPENAEIRLIHNGKIRKIWHNQHICSFTTHEPGFYRVECYLNYLGKRRGWIFSNPIFVERQD